MQVHVDSVAFKRKPVDGEIGGIKSRFINPDTIQDVTVEQVIHILANGQTIQPAVTPFSEESRKQKKNGTCAEDFKCQEMFGVDHDNKLKNEPIETPEYIEQRLAQFNLPLAFAYQTFHSKPGVERYRSFIVSKEVITDKKERDAIQEALIKLFPQSDKGCTNADRIFFGTDKGMCEGVGDIHAVCEKADLIALAKAMGTLESNGDNEKSDKPKFGQIIPTGQRHATLVSFASSVLKRYGTDDTRAYDLFMQRVAQCESPKPDDEVQKIWRDACKFYENTISKNPNYVPPTSDFEEVSTVKWEKPIPFEELSLPPFPVDALPSKVKPYVVAVAETTQTPVDMAATASLAVMASCVQGKYAVRAKADWTEPLNLYTLMVAEPSERKSAVTSHMVRPVNQFEMEYNKLRSASLEKNRMQKRILEKRQRAIEDKVAKGKAEENELEDIVEEIARFKELSPMQHYVDDVTPEKLVSVLADHNGVASIISAEGGIFDQLAGGMYSKAVNIDVFLKGHAGDTIRIDRIGRNSESVENPALTMLLAVQPNVLAGLIQNNTFRGRGLTARFLYTMPESHVGTRRYRTEPIPEDAEREYYSLIHNLLDEDSNPSIENPEIITLSEDADAMLENFANELEPKLRTEYADFSDWAGKLCGAVARIAGLLCRAERKGCYEFLQEPEPPIIDVDTLQRAIAIGRYYTEHARAAYLLMGADPIVKQCKYVLKAIKGTGSVELSKRDILRLCRSFKKAEELNPVIERLCEYGYLAEKAEQSKSVRGRPQSTTYLVNPSIYGE